MGKGFLSLKMFITLIFKGQRAGGGVSPGVNQPVVKL